MISSLEGNPQLVTFSQVDRTVRLFELSAGVFVQVASKGISVTDPRPPTGPCFSGFYTHSAAIIKPEESLAGSWHAYICGVYGGAGGHKEYYVSMELPSMAELRAYRGGGNQSGYKNRIHPPWPEDPGHTAHVSNHSGTRVVRSRADGYLSHLAGGIRLYNEGPMSPDKKWFVGNTGGKSYFYDTREFTNSPARKSQISQAEVHGNTWSADGRFAFMHSLTGEILVYQQTEAGDFEFASSLRFPNEREVNLLVGSPDTRWVIAAQATGGVPTSYIYRRVGPYLSLVGIVENFGGQLDFTQDSRLLVDAWTRRALEFGENGYTENTEVMANIPAGVSAQALSMHQNVPKGIGRLYDYALATITRGKHDLKDLKLALLTEEHKFVPTHNTFNEVLDGKWAVRNLNWEPEGKSLGNPHWVSTRDSLTLRADPIKCVPIEEAMKFRYGLVYDASLAEDSPLIWIDFKTTLTAEPGVELVIDLNSLGLLVYRQ